MAFRRPKLARLHVYAGIGVAMLVVSGCRPAPQSVRRERPADPAASADVGIECPYGHAAVRRAEVLYGLLIPSDDLRRSVDAGEVVTGGCVVDEGTSPAYLLVCRTCDFRMDPVTEVWTRRSADPRTFERPLAAPILAFPLADKSQIQVLDYEQRFQDGRMTNESVGYWTAEPADVILPRVQGFAAGQGAELVPLNPETNDARWLRYELSIDDVPGELQVSRTQSGDAHVSFDYPPAQFPDARNPAAAVKVDE